MKRLVVFAVLMASAVTLFATGIEESAPAGDDTLPRFGRGAMPGPMGPAFADDEAVWNPVELTGTVGFVEEHPVLNVDGEIFLVAGPAMMYADEMESGTEVMVRGQLVEDISNDLVQYSVDGMIYVEQAEIDGELIVLSGPGFGPDRAFGGRMGGRMGGRGFAPRDDDSPMMPRRRW